MGLVGIQGYEPWNLLWTIYISRVLLGYQTPSLLPTTAMSSLPNSGAAESSTPPLPPCPSILPSSHRIPIPSIPYRLTSPGPERPSSPQRNPDKDPRTADQRFRATTTLLSILRQTISKRYLEITTPLCRSYTKRLDSLAELLSRDENEEVAVVVRYQRFPKYERPMVYICVSSPDDKPAESGGVSVVEVQGLNQELYATSAKLTPPLTPWLLSHPKATFQHHAAVLLGWLRTASRKNSSSDDRRDRFELLDAYVLFRSCSKMLARLDSGMEEYWSALEEVERRWESGEINIEGWTGDCAGYKGDLKVTRRLWTRQAVLDGPGEEMWPTLLRAVKRREEAEIREGRRNSEELMEVCRQHEGEISAAIAEVKDTEGFESALDAQDDDDEGGGNGSERYPEGVPDVEDSEGVVDVEGRGSCCILEHSGDTEQPDDSADVSESTGSEIEPYAADPILNASTSRGFNAFILHLLSEIHSDLSLLVAYTHAGVLERSKEEKAAFTELRRSIHLSVWVFYNLLNDSSEILQAHMHWVASILGKDRQYCPPPPKKKPTAEDNAAYAVPDLLEIPKPKTVRYDAGVWGNHRIMTGWTDACNGWFELIYKPMECAHCFQGTSGFSTLRKILPECDVSIVRCRLGDRQMMPWEDIVRDIVEGGGGEKGHTELIVSHLREEAEMADEASPLKKLLGDWKFDGKLHPTSLMAGLNSFARERAMSSETSKKVVALPMSPRYFTHT